MRQIYSFLVFKKLYSERLAYAFIGLHKNVPPCDSQVANDI